VNIALIIARLGSKRIKNKSIKNFYGKPIIYYPIRVCQKSKIFDKIYISTESKKIKLIANRLNTLVPFLRPKKLANKSASTIEVIQNFIKTMKLPMDTNICCLYPATPLLKVSLLKKFYKKFLKAKKDFLVPVQRAEISEKRAFAVDKKGKIIKKNKSKFFFKDSGQFYFGTAQVFNKKKSILFDGNCRTILISKQSAVDVNTSDDWKLIKKLFKKNKN